MGRGAAGEGYFRQGCVAGSRWRTQCTRVGGGRQQRPPWTRATAHPNWQTLRTRSQTRKVAPSPLPLCCPHLDILCLHHTRLHPGRVRAASNEALHQPAVQGRPRARRLWLRAAWHRHHALSQGQGGWGGGAGRRLGASRGRMLGGMGAVGTANPLGASAHCPALTP